MKGTNKVIIRAPQQQEFRNPEAILDTGKLAEWLNELPLLNPAPTVRELMDAVQAVNRQKVSNRKRLQLLDQYRKVAIQIYPSLTQDALKRISSKENEREKIHHQVTLFCTHIADGYKIIIRNLLADGNTLKNDQLFAPLYCAIEALSLALLNCYRTYLSTPEFLFQDIHQLYLLAERSALLNYEYESDIGSASAPSISLMYRQMMILAFLDPFKMPYGAVEQLYQRLFNLSEYCNMLSQQPGPDQSGIFVVDLASDEAPRAIYKIPANRNLKIPRVFDTHPLTNKINADITVIKTGQEKKALIPEEQLLRLLIPPHKEQTTRKAERTDSHRIAKVTFGIDAVYHFLTMNKTELKQALQSHADNVGDYRMEPWQVSNESKTGLSLSDRNMTQHDVRVGDIIGLLTEQIDLPGSGTAELCTKIAIIRWIRNQDNQIHIGVELIHGNLLPATCYIVDDQDSNQRNAGIFISSSNNENTPPTLLTPKGVYQRGRILDITVGEQPMRIEAGYLKDDTFTFDRFDFKSNRT